MLLSFFVSRSIAHVITCTHNYHLDTELRSLSPKPLKTRRILEGEKLNESIRICFDMKSIDDSSYDNQQCTESNMIDKCQYTDILDDTKRKVIKETFANVETFLEKNINVTRATNPIDTADIYSKSYAPDVSNCDLFIVVYARPFGEGSSGLAFASARQASDQDGRPIKGYITVNPTKIPLETQTFDSGARQFIVTVLHEINHILAFSSGLFHTWKNSNGTTYDPLFRYADEYGEPVLENATDRVIHQYLATPRLTDWVNKRFHVNPNKTDKYGLEIEDGGGAGTKGAHPNQRLYFTDLMQGRTYGPGYIGPIFYNTLLDSGWYKPSTNVIEKLTYLDDKLEVDSTTQESILYGPPVNTFPKSHLCDIKQDVKCFYDHIYTGICALKDVSSITDEQLSSEPYKSYYNPKSSSTVGQDDLLDYVPTILPWYNCRDNGTAGKDRRGYVNDDPSDYGEVFGNQSVCAMSTLYQSSFFSTFLETPRCFDSYCGDDMKVRITVGGVSQVCDRDGKKLKWEGYSGYVVCPPSAVVCANRKEYKEVLAITSMIPDRGPIDGKNLVSIKGTNFGNYSVENLVIKFGKIDCKALMVTETELLCQLASLTEEEKTEYYQRSGTISAHDTASNKSSISEFKYTFTGRSYDAGSISAKPAMILLALCSVVALFFF